MKILFAIISIGTEYTQAQIARMTGVDPKTVGRLIKMLQKDFSQIDYQVKIHKTIYG